MMCAAGSDVNQPPATRLTLIRRNGSMCDCHCACGKTVTIKWVSFKYSRTRSCGCLRRETAAQLRLNPILPGASFGRLTVLEWKGAYTRCSCSCSNKEVLVSSVHLRSGHTQSCGCWQKELARGASRRFISVGTRFTRLTVVEYHPLVSLCHCDCGKDGLKVENKKLRSGHVRSCGCLRVEQAHKMSQNKVGTQTGLWTPTELAFRSLLSVYRHQAIQRGLVFSLTDEDVKTITSQPCAICGAAPFQIKRTANRKGVYVYTGLDRIDNAQGYVTGNVQPCCGPCNFAKAEMPFETFKLWLQQLKATVEMWPKGPRLLPVSGELNVAGRALLNRYAQCAKHDNRLFALSHADFLRYTSQPCFYCGVAPSKIYTYGKHTYSFNGLDRRDAALGYIIENVVPACWACNNAKGVGSVEEFAAWITRCCQHLGI